MLKAPSITLKDGTRCRVEPCSAPPATSDDEIACSVDVRLDDGSLLEFTAALTGHGMPFAQRVASAKRGKGRSR